MALVFNIKGYPVEDNRVYVYEGFCSDCGQKVINHRMGVDDVCPNCGEDLDWYWEKGLSDEDVVGVYMQYGYVDDGQADLDWEDTLDDDKELLEEDWVDDDLYDLKRDEYLTKGD